MKQTDAILAMATGEYWKRGIYEPASYIFFPRDDNFPEINA